MDPRFKAWFASPDDWKNFEGKIINAYVEQRLDVEISQITIDSFEVIESPIELLFYVAWQVCYDSNLIEWQCIPQFNFPPYRFDFAFIHSIENQVALLIECDGFNFHERTKEQASYDRAKDRFAQSKGLVIFRFTGTDLWTRLSECLDEVKEFLWKQPATDTDLLVKTAERLHLEDPQRLIEWAERRSLDECARIAARLKLQSNLGQPDALV